MMHGQLWILWSWYAAYVLKTKGKIIKTFLVFKETDVNTCKDLGAYAASMAPKLSTLAGVMILYGVVSLINTYVVSIMSLYWVMMVALIGTLKCNEKIFLNVFLILTFF